MLNIVDKLRNMKIEIMIVVDLVVQRLLVIFGKVVLEE